MRRVFDSSIDHDVIPFMSPVEQDFILWAKMIGVDDELLERAATFSNWIDRRTRPGKIAHILQVYALAVIYAVSENSAAWGVIRKPFLALASKRRNLRDHYVTAREHGAA